MAAPLDVLTRPVKFVKGGSAVEFPDGSNFLQMNKSVGDFRKGVVSFWFRIPTQSVDTCRNTSDLGAGFFPMWRVVPLVSWGPQHTFLRDVGDSGPMPPSYIGILVGYPSSPEESLAVNLQTVDVATHNDPVFAGTYPETFSNWQTRISLGGFPSVLVNNWNHVILSWDLSNSSAAGGQAGSSSKMWCSINDVNKSGDSDLPALISSFYGMGANDHVSADRVSRALGDNTATASVSVSSMESNPFCIPAIDPLQYNTDLSEVGTRTAILKVAMADLQVFAGITLDTSLAGNRRAFIDGNGKPVPPSQAQEFLGKRPEILLSGSGNWINGRNAGTLGVNYATDPPETIAAGQFDPTGTIEPFKPGPGL